MNPKTNEIPELKELWQRIVVSYRANDLEELEEAEILVNKFLVDHHLDGNEIKIQDIDTKIEKLKEQIQKIKETNPYQYRFLLQDQEAVQNKKRELQKELEEYRVYEQELDQLLVIRRCIDNIMETNIHFRDLGNIAALYYLLELLCHAFQLAYLFFGDLFARQLYRQFFQRSSHFQDVS